MSVKDYVSHVRSLMAQLSAMPPAENDCILNLFDGLNERMKQEARIDPRTGKFWTNFNDFAQHLVTLETHLHKPKPAFSGNMYTQPKSGVQKYKPNAHVAAASHSQAPPKQRVWGQKPNAKPGGQGGSGPQQPPHKKQKQHGKPPGKPPVSHVTVPVEQWQAMLAKKN